MKYMYAGLHSNMYSHHIARNLLLRVLCQPNLLDSNSLQLQLFWYLT